MTKQTVFAVVLVIAIMMMGAGLYMEIGDKPLIQWSTPVITGNQAVDSSVAMSLILISPGLGLLATHASPALIALLMSIGMNFIGFVEGLIPILYLALVFPPAGFLWMAVYIFFAVIALAVSGILMSAGFVLGTVSLLEILTPTKKPQASGTAG